MGSHAFGTGSAATARPAGVELDGSAGLAGSHRAAAGALAELKGESMYLPELSAEDQQQTPSEDGLGSDDAGADGLAADAGTAPGPSEREHRRLIAVAQVSQHLTPLRRLRSV
jgi:hypothetical protein